MKNLIYSQVGFILSAFEKYIRDLPTIESLPQSPIVGLSIDTNEFLKVKRAMSSLPSCELTKASQFFSRPSQKIIKDYRERYACALSEYSKKCKVSTTIVAHIFKTVVPTDNFTTIIEEVNSRLKIPTENAEDTFESSKTKLVTIAA